MRNKNDAWLCRLRSTARRALPWLGRAHGGLLRAVYGREKGNFVISPDDVSTAEKMQSDLHCLFYSNTGTLVQKGRHYLEIYDHHLSRFRNTPFRMLEIGVSEGGSLTVWRKYFGYDAILFGIDINPTRRQLDKRDAHVRIGSQDDPEFLKSVASEMGGIDVVLDDGSHVATHQRTSFQTLFPLLNDGGVYICEDLHTAYWADYQGGYGRRGTFIEVAKQIIDDIHADFHNQLSSVPNAHQIIHGIHFYNSILVIEKRPQQKPVQVRVGTPALIQKNDAQYKIRGLSGGGDNE